MSGAGKSTALKCLEDYGFYCVDNMPPNLLPEIVKLFDSSGSNLQDAAFGIDIRMGVMFDPLFDVINSLRGLGHTVSVIFLDCADSVLEKRYKETRRSHPLAKNERICVGIDKERGLLKTVREKADYVLDTSYFLTRQLREKISEIFLEHKEYKNLIINIITFGFKHGIPEDSDLCFDVRFMPNPHYTHLRPFSGLDERVRDFVLSSEGCAEFLERVTRLLDFLIPRYVSEGKNKLVVSVGCTGGKHRSVCLGAEIYAHLQNNGQSVLINHRDIEKDSKY
jgi:UPF0042 nucleotide-binding protein